jgi:predicted ABC-type ATPase
VGYSVSLYFITLPNADLAVARVAARVQQGGHNIPESVIRRRFIDGQNNFELRYRQAVDDWAVYDNAGHQPRLIDWGQSP